MADVWFAKDAPASSGAASAAAATHDSSTRPSLGDLLAAPSADLMPGGGQAHVSPVHAADHASTAGVAHGLLHARRHDEDDPGRQAPLI